MNQGLSLTIKIELIYLIIMHKKKIIKEEVSPKLAPILCIVDFVGFVGVFLYKEIIFF